MNANYSILLGLFLTCLAIRTSYEFLKRAHRITEENKPAFTIVLVAMILLWVSWFAMCPVDPYRVEMPAVIHSTGLVLCGIGLVLAFAALAQLRGVEHIDHLVIKGLYAVTRHPMYIGFVLWITGWATYHGAALSLVPGMVCIGNIVFWARLEDERLLVRYGDVYRQYRDGTLF